jgi:DNA invertase Pin-like site-specific DNA recombinase
MKAFAYLRVSGKGQVDGDGFPRQLAAVKAYAAANGFTIPASGIYREKGVSGENELENRPALMDLLTTPGGVKHILVEKLDRLARDLMVQETIIADLRKRGITLISVAEPDLLRDDPSRKLMRQIFGAISEYEKAMIVAKLRGARQRIKAREGRCEGAKPYGELPGENVVLEQMRQLRSDGLGFARIARHLNDNECRPRQGARWHGRVIDRILTKAVRSEIE